MVPMDASVESGKPERELNSATLQSEGPRTAKDIIDQAINENRFGERLLYAFATVVVLVGAGAIVAGIVSRSGLVALAGAIASSLFVPAMNAARRTRRENLCIRLMEAPLSRAETATEAADALRKVFYNLFNEGSSDSEPSSGGKALVPVESI
jgi:hypothetical protein